MAPPPPLGAVAISHQLLVAPPTCRMLVVLFPVEWKMRKLVKIWRKICRVHYHLARLQRNNIKLLIGRRWKVQFLSGWNSHQNGHSSYVFAPWSWSIQEPSPIQMLDGKLASSKCLSQICRWLKFDKKNGQLHNLHQHLHRSLLSWTRKVKAIAFCRWSWCDFAHYL